MSRELSDALQILMWVTWMVWVVITIKMIALEFRKKMADVEQGKASRAPSVPSADEIDFAKRADAFVGKNRGEAVK